MDPITSSNMAMYAAPASSATVSPSAPTTSSPSAVDSVTLGQADANNLANIYWAPDPAFAALLQSDSALADDYVSSSQSQFGYDDLVLANDDTLPTNSQISTAANSAPSTNTVDVAQQGVLGALTFEGGVVGALFGSSSSADPSAIFFTGTSMNNLLTANGTAALAYLTPQAAAAGASINATA